jgi:hypothetical protein
MRQLVLALRGALSAHILLLIAELQPLPNPAPA